MNKWHNLSGSDVVRVLKSNKISGLSNYEVEERKVKHGDNKIVIPNTKNIISIFLKEFLSIWSILSFGLSLLMISIKLYMPALFFVATYIFLLVIFLRRSIVQNKTYDVFKVLNNYSALVIRDGREQRINVEEVVVGDIVILEKGKFVPADIRLIECKDLKVKELAVTGEDYEVEKYDVRMYEKSVPVTRRNNMVYRSTVVSHGEGKGVVTAVGMNTQMGNMASKIERKEEYGKDIYFQSKRILAWGNLISTAAALVFMLFNIVSGKEILQATKEFMSIVYIGNSNILILCFFIFVHIFVNKLKKENLEVNDLLSLNKLNQFDTIFCNKEGVVTNDTYNLSSVFCNDSFYKITGANKFIKLDSNELKDINEEFRYDETLNRLLNILIYNNDNNINSEDGNYKGNSYEIGISKFLQKNFSIDINNINKDIMKIPYDNDRRIKTKVNRIDNNYRAHTIGAIDSIIERCTHILKDGIEVELMDSHKEEIKKKVYSMSKEGMIILGCSYRNFNYSPSISENIESNMVFVGMVGMVNSIDSNCRETLRYFQTRNIRMIINSKENKVAATTLGRELGLIKGKESAVLGAELEFLSEKEIDRISSVCSVYSNANAQQKLALIKSISKVRSRSATFVNKLTDLPIMKHGAMTVAYGDKCSNIIKSISDIYLKKGTLNCFRYIIKKLKQIILVFSELSSLIFMYISAVLSFAILNSIINGNLGFNVKSALWINSINMVIVASAVIVNIMINTDNKELKLMLKNNNFIDNTRIKKYIGVGVIIGTIATIAPHVINEFVSVKISGNSSLYILILLINFCSFYFEENSLLFKSILSNILILLNVNLLLVLLNIPKLGSVFAFNVISLSEIKAYLILLVACFGVCILIKNILISNKKVK